MISKNYWFAVNLWLKKFIEKHTKFLTARNKYEFINALIAWEINAKYEVNTDLIDQALKKSNQSRLQFKKEIENKGLGICSVLIADLFNTPIPELDVQYIIRYNNVHLSDIEGNQMKFKITKRDRYFLTFLSEDILVTALCRYSIFNLQYGGKSSHQWANDYRRTKKKKKKKVEAEAFASMWNVDIEHTIPTRKFCSAFEDDKEFGSMGSFFNLSDKQYNEPDIWYVNPPFTEIILEAAAKITVNKINNFSFIMSYWADSKAYKILSDYVKNNTEYHEVILKRFKHSYWEANNSSPIIARFDSVLFEKKSNKDELT